MVKYHSQRGTHWSSGDSFAAVRLWLTLASCQVPTQLLTHSLLQQRKWDGKAHGSQSSLANYCHEQKRLHLGNFICCQLK